MNILILIFNYFTSSSTGVLVIWMNLLVGMIWVIWKNLVIWVNWMIWMIWVIWMNLVICN